MKPRDFEKQNYEELSDLGGKKKKVILGMKLNKAQDEKPLQNSRRPLYSEGN